MRLVALEKSYSDGLTLDARLIDPVIRQSAIFGVLVGLPPAGTVTIVTHENPAPIADLLHERLPGEYDCLLYTSRCV